MNMRKVLLLIVCVLIALLPMQILATETQMQSIFTGQQLFLGDDLTMHFYAQLSQAHTADGVVAVTVGDEVYGEYTVKDMTAKEDGSYDFAVNLGAPEMTETISLTLISGGETALQQRYSIREYAQYLLDGNYNDETKALVLQLLNYGAKAQLYFGNKIDDLANAGNELQTTQSMPEEMPQISITGKADGIRYYGSTMVFRTKVAMRYYFQVTGDIEEYEFAVNGNTQQPVSKDGCYYIEVADINPQEMDTDMTVAVSDGTNTMSFCYCPTDYIVRMYNKDDTAQELKDMLLAANGYFQAAKVFAGVKAPQPVFTVSDAVAAAGEQITVTIDFAHNPGLLGTMLTLTYDEDILTLNSAKNGTALSGLSYMKPSRLKSGCNFVWFGSNSSPAQDGTVLTLTFTVAEDAPAGSYSIAVECSESDTFDSENNPLRPEVKNGTVTVS